MRTRILALLVGSALTVATLVAAPAASAASAFTDMRADAPVSALPFSTSVDLTGATTSADDPTDCSVMQSNVWTSFELPDPATVDLLVPTFNWNWSAIVAIYPHGSDTAISCQAGMGSLETPLALAAGQYDVLVGSMDSWLTSVDVGLEILSAPANDDWTAPQTLDLPATGSYDLRAATLQPDEPLPPCGDQPASRSQWYSFTAPDFGWIYIADNWTMTNTYALYTASPTGGPPVYADQCANMGGTLRATPGVEYLLQVAGYSAIAGTFSIMEAPELSIRIGYWPDDPSTYDEVSFSVYADNGAGERATLDFGDGSPIASTTDCQMSASFFHRYAKDGAYTLTATMLATDGRTSTVTNHVTVRTHDVAISTVTAPRTATVGKAKQVAVSVVNLGKYTEQANVYLYASTPSGEWLRLGSTSVVLPVTKKAVTLGFTWIPGASDVGQGVVLRAVIDPPIDPDLQWALRDARPENNELTSTPIRVSR